MNKKCFLYAITIVVFSLKGFCQNALEKAMYFKNNKPIVTNFDTLSFYYSSILDSPNLPNIALFYSNPVSLMNINSSYVNIEELYNFNKRFLVILIDEFNRLIQIPKAKLDHEKIKKINRYISDIDYFCHQFDKKNNLLDSSQYFCSIVSDYLSVGYQKTTSTIDLPPSLKSPTLSSFGFTVPSSLNFTTELIKGTSDFLVDRIKKELELAFFDKFREKINDNRDLRELMPFTHLLLSSQDFYYSPTLGSTWKAAFEKDLKELPNTLYLKVIKDADFMPFIDRDELELLMNAYKIVEKLRNGFHLTTAIQYINPKENKDNLLSCIISISNGLRLSDTTGTNSSAWVSLDDFDALSKEEQKYFLFFLYQDNETIFKKFEKEFNEGAVNKYILSIRKLLFALHQYDIVLNQITQRKEKLMKEGKVENVSTSQDFSQILITLREIYSAAFQLAIELELIKDNNKSIVLLNSAINITQYINQRNYSSMLIEFIYVLNQIKNEDTKNELSDFSQKLLFYGGFMVDVVNADSAVQFQQIIEKYASPVGSYRVTRNSKRSGAITAYPGLFAGYENNFKTKASQSFVYGVTAPIGFSFNWGKLKCDSSKNSSKSFSVFVPVFDIGAPVSYRFSNDSLRGFPDNVSLAQVFSPGLYFVWGFRNVPIALKAGIQHTPLLRKIENDNAVIGSGDMWRIGATLSVDIPIFQLYSKNERKVKKSEKKPQNNKKCTKLIKKYKKKCKE
jgi:hypothetical protein